jgi:transcriptional regulator with XRE-family HTH domain
MHAADIRAEAHHIKHLMSRLGLTQEVISIATGISQSQVSRVLSGKAVRRSRAFDAVCNYVQHHSRSVPKEEVRICTPLIEALALVWDGTQTHADALASVIRSLGALPSSPPSHSRRSTHRNR